MNDKRPSIKRIGNLSRAKTNERIYPDLAPAITRVTNAGKRVKNAGLFLFNFITESIYLVSFSSMRPRYYFIYTLIAAFPPRSVKNFILFSGVSVKHIATN